MAPSQEPALAGVKPPPATLISLIEVHALQVLLFTGRQPDPRTGQAGKNLDFAQHNIEMLEMLKEKTQGNRTDAETRALDQYLNLARLAYVEAVKESETDDTTQE